MAAVRALADPIDIPTLEALLAGWGEQLADPTIITILRAALAGGRRGEVRLFFSTRGLAARPPAIYVDPTTPGGRGL